MKKYYLAYGSNLNVEQMKFRCPGAIPIGKATIKGYRLLFKGSKTGSYLTIEKGEGFDVPVGVWEVNEKHERMLDRYEGYPRFYYKAECKVEMITFEGKKKMIDAFVYIMHEEHFIGVPTGDYMTTCLQGYHDFHFKPEFLTDAYKYSKENCR